MRLCCREACRLQHRSDQFIIKPQHTVQKLAVVDVVGFLVTVELHSISHHLLLRDVFEYKEFGIEKAQPKKDLRKEKNSASQPLPF